MKQKIWKKLLIAALCLCFIGAYFTVYAEEGTEVTEDVLEETTDDVVGDEAAEDDGVKEEEPEVEPIPMNVKTARLYTRQIKLTWTSDREDTVYRITRIKKSTGLGKEVATVAARLGEMTYTDKNLTLGESYQYLVEELAEEEVIESQKTGFARIRLRKAENVKVSCNSNNEVKITWNKVDYASGYYISRSTKKNGEYKRVGTVKSGTLSYTDKTVASGKTYYYKVRPYRKDNAKADGLLSDATAKVSYTKPAKVKVTGTYTTSKKIKLSWKKVTGATHYIIYRRNSSGEYVKKGTTSNLYYYDSKVTELNTYKYKVAAYYKKSDRMILGKKSATCTVLASQIDPNKKMVALTFDDGPGPYTQAIVDCLKKNGGKATFFVVGNRINTYKSAFKSAHVNGNEIANHTYSHPILTYCSSSTIKSEVNKTDELIKEVTGKKAALMRAPGGATNSTVKSIVKKPFIYWSIDTLDWKTRSTSATVSCVMDNVYDGAIILMHDIHSPTKDAALQIIPKLKKAGYQLVTVSEMAKVRGYELENGTTYFDFE